MRTETRSGRSRWCAPSPWRHHRFRGRSRVIGNCILTRALTNGAQSVPHSACVSSPYTHTRCIAKPESEPEKKLKTKQKQASSGGGVEKGANPKIYSKKVASVVEGEWFAFYRERNTFGFSKLWGAFELPLLHSIAGHSILSLLPLASRPTALLPSGRERVPVPPKHYLAIKIQGDSREQWRPFLWSPDVTHGYHTHTLALYRLTANTAHSRIHTHAHTVLEDFCRDELLQSAILLFGGIWPY